MEAILAWQLGVVTTIIIARLFSSGTMALVAFAWTAFTFLAVWANALVVLQLGSVWITVWMLTAVFGPTLEPKEDAASPPQKQEPPPTTLLALRPETGGNKSAVASVFSKVSTIAEATTQLVEDITQTLEDASRNLRLQLETQKANSEIVDELRSLKSSIQVALMAGKDSQKLNRNCEDPEFAEEYNRTLHGLEQEGPRSPRGSDTNRKNVRSGPIGSIDEGGSGARIEKLDMKGLTLAPATSDDLGPLAANDRVNRLRGALELVRDTQKQINRDKILHVAIDQNLKQAFSPFLSAQFKVLEQHLAALVSPSAPTCSPQTKLLLKEENPVRPQRSPSPDRISQRAPPAAEDTEAVRTYYVTATREPAVTLTAIARTNPRGAPSPPLTDPAITRLNRDKIKSLAQELGIPHLVHFTRCENLPKILEHGLMSIETCSHRRIDQVCNDTNRYDGQPDAISLSIAFPNYRMFYRYRALLPSTEWAVLLISSSTLWEKDCGFYRNNAADARMIRMPREDMKSAQALRAMFLNDADRESFLRSFDPTDPQAEVLCYDTIEASRIEAIAFETREICTKNRSILHGLESFYAGPNAGLFASRLHTRGN